MRKLRTYLRLTWLFFISLFVPTATLQGRVDQLLAELKTEPRAETEADGGAT